MDSKWRHLIWAVPLGFVALILVLTCHRDHNFWRSAPALMQLAQDAVRRGEYSEAVELAAALRVAARRRARRRPGMHHARR